MFNYWESTNADFKPVAPGDALLILQWFFTKSKFKKPKSGEDFLILNDLLITPDFVSNSKNSYWKSRSISYYFRTGKNEIIRISDHWSKSQYDKSKKLNCGFIRSCFWTNLKGEKFDFKFPGETYKSEIIAGILPLSKFKQIPNVNG